MVKSNTMLQAGLNQLEGAYEVCVDKWPGGLQGIIVVAFGCKMHDHISLGDEAIDNPRIANIALDKLIAPLKPCKV